MKIPSFLGKPKQAHEVGFSLPSGIHDAPGWRVVPEPPHFSCIEPAGGPFVDKDVLRAIRVFKPDVVPVWVTKRWLPPGSMRPINESRIALGWRESDPKRKRFPFKCDMPTGADFPRPNVVTMPLDVLRRDGPSDPIPFDSRAYHLAREWFCPGGPVEAAERLREKQRRESWLEAQKAESARQDEEALQRELERIMKFYDPKDSDWNAYYGELVKQRAKSTQKGVDGNPFIHMRGAA